MLSFHVIYGTGTTFYPILNLENQLDTIKKLADKRLPEMPGCRKSPAHQGSLKDI